MIQVPAPTRNSLRGTIRLALLLALVIAIPPLSAQEAAVEPYRSRTVVLPFGSYSPETRLQLGGVMVYQFKPGAAGPETRASQILTSGIYTLNRQLLFECIPNVILPREEWILDGVYQYAFYPNRYWGIGPGAPEEAELDVEYRRINFQQTMLRRLTADFFAGPVLRWTRLSGVKFRNEAGEPVAADGIIGSEGSSLPGVGFSVRWDKRNSITTPTENHYLDLAAIFYPGFLGATHPHQS